jgi:hypothetical protein
MAPVAGHQGGAGRFGDIIRTRVTWLALALGFARLARRPGSALSLLAELQIDWQKWRHCGRGLQERSGRSFADEDDLRQIGGAANGEGYRSAGHQAGWRASNSCDADLRNGGWTNGSRPWPGPWMRSSISPELREGHETWVEPFDQARAMPL